MKADQEPPQVAGPSAQPRPEPRPALPRAIWVLGFVSLLMDVSSEMVHSLLPLFLVGSFGLSVVWVGWIEGVAEATALIVKMFSGAWSDRLRRRKGLALAGYALGALSKPAFALANSAGAVFAARCVDRIGKGLRGAPRDALVADLVPAPQRGAAYGLRQSLDTVGACAGPLLATALMLLWANDFRTVFWCAALPGLLAVLLLAVGVREPPAGPHVPAQQVAPSGVRLGRVYWQVVALGAVFTLARFSEAFLLLRAQQLGVPLAWVPLVMVAMNLVYALSAFPLGRLSDAWPRAPWLAAGALVLMAADLVLAFATGWPALLVGVALWGLHMGMTQGLLAAMVADAAAPSLRGTAFGAFNLVSGVALLLASGLAGLLWDRLGAPATFLAGAALAALTLLGCAVLRVGRARPG